MQDLRFNCRFADVMKSTKEGIRVADFRRFDQVIQNTVMPVPYGLTPKQTEAINGPDIIHKGPKGPPASVRMTTATATTSLASTPSSSGRWNGTGALSPQVGSAQVADAVDPGGAMTPLCSPSCFF
jgi:hypothetical protein